MNIPKEIYCPSVRLKSVFLEAHRSTDRQLIGYFPATSTITGAIYEDVNVTGLLHTFGALSFWNYVAGAPSVAIEMNPKVYN